jgi:hypothetical protein
MWENAKMKSGSSKLADKKKNYAAKFHLWGIRTEMHPRHFFCVWGTNHVSPDMILNVQVWLTIILLLSHSWSVVKSSVFWSCVNLISQENRTCVSNFMKLKRWQAKLINCCKSAFGDATMIWAWVSERFCHFKEGWMTNKNDKHPARAPQLKMNH